MAGSMQDIIRGRQSDGFVGRDAPLAYFRENLALAPADPRKRFLFNVHGDGGVDKTFLLTRLRRIADDAGAVSAYVDERPLV